MRIATIFFWRLCILQNKPVLLATEMLVHVLLGNFHHPWWTIDWDVADRLYWRWKSLGDSQPSRRHLDLGHWEAEGVSKWRISEVKIWKRENGYGRAMVTWCNVSRFWCFRILQFQLLEKRVHGELPMEINRNHWARVIAWRRFRGKFVLQSMPDHDSNISCWGTSYRATYTMFQAAVGWHWSSVRVSCEGLEH